MPAPILTRSDLEVIAKRPVAGDSDAVIAADLGVERSTVRKARGRPTFAPLLAHERRLAANREKSARYRQRQRAKAAVESDPPFASPPTGSALMATLPGQEYPRLERRSTAHAWRYIPQVGWSSWATREQCRRFKVDPGTLEADSGFGDPDYSRHALGYVPPEQRLIRLRAPAGTHEGDIELVKPVPACDVPALEAQGWTRVEPRPAPARGQAG